MNWPYQPLLPSAAQLQAGGGGPTYTLTAAVGSFALTGQAAGLRVSRLLTAVAGSFALSGQAVTLKASRKLTAEVGTFTLSGQAATLTYPFGGPTYTLTASFGSFALAGQPAALRYTRALAAAAGSFALSGQSASLKVSRRLAAGVGSFVLSGQDVTLDYSGAVPSDFVLTAEQGGFTVTGMAVDLRVIGPTQTAPTTPLAVQKGILRAAQIGLHAATITLVGNETRPRVFDHVPQQRDFPFVAMDQHQVVQNDGCDIHGFIHTFYLSFWSDYRGSKQVWEMLDAVWLALHDQRLLLENGVHVLCQVTEQRADVDADGVTYMGNLTARIHTNPFGSN